MPLMPTDEQLKIIGAPPTARLLVEAGPGTGKTEVVARRLANLLGTEALRPSQILVLSFSRSAVKALISRIRRLGEHDPDAVDELRHLSVRTFDSWTFRILRFIGADPGELLRNGYEANIARLVAELKSPAGRTTVLQGAPALEKVRHVLIDEVQDLGGSRAELVLALLRLLCPPGSDRCGFTLLGDFRQAIYGFAGRHDAYSSLTALQFRSEVKRDWGPELQERTLSRNHRTSGENDAVVRSAAEILDRALADRENPVPKLTQLFARLPRSGADDLALGMIASKATDRSTAVLCRDRKQIVGIAADVESWAYNQQIEVGGIQLMVGMPPRNLPAWVAGLLHRFEGKDLNRSLFERICRLVANETPAVTRRLPECGAAWSMLLKFAHRSDSDTTVGMDELRQRIAWPDSLPDDEGEGESRLVITTIHQSKGLEFDDVHVMRGSDHEQEDRDWDEEGRVLFVGLSRARKSVSNLHANGNCHFRELDLHKNRKRWYRMLPRPSYARQLELGCDGDVDCVSVVSTGRMQGEDAVRQIQELLMRSEDELIGRKVILQKSPLPGPALRFVYRITVESGPHKDRCLGFTTEQMTHDLLDVLQSDRAKFRLPGKIYNLRIGAISTFASTADVPHDVPTPWSRSRLWLVPVIHGISTFKPQFRQSGE